MNSTRKLVVISNRLQWQTFKAKFAKKTFDNLQRDDAVLNFLARQIYADQPAGGSVQ